MLGKEHPSTLMSMNSLAMVLKDQGKYEQAEEMLRQALRLEHPSALRGSYASIFLVYRSRARFGRIRRRNLSQIQSAPPSLPRGAESSSRASDTGIPALYSSGVL